MQMLNDRQPGLGEISYANPVLDPLVFRALNPLGLGSDFTREELKSRAHLVSKDYVVTMEASGVTPNVALAKFGVSGSDPVTTWMEAQYFVFQQVMRHMESYDRFMSGGLSYD
jgi:hypothetical protein